MAVYGSSRVKSRKIKKIFISWLCFVSDKFHNINEFLGKFLGRGAVFKNLESHKMNIIFTHEAKMFQLFNLL